MVSIPSTLLDPSSPVGLHFLPATTAHPPLRIFYPSTTNTNTNTSLPHQSTGWFDETGVVDYLEGYLHTFGILEGNSWTSRWIVKPWLHLLSLALPLKWLRLPGVYRDSPPRTGKYPLIVFSHGLTGTGQENSALCASWAKEGMVVVSVWHTDGSSCRVPMADGTIRYYEPSPPITQYDAEFRPRQVQQRADELFQARNLMLTKDNDGEDALLQHIRKVIDPTRVVAAGYSYGAATVARAISQMIETTDCSQATIVKPTQLDFQAAIFLDGWFHIDIQKSAGIEFEFPKQAFEHLNQGGEWPIPSLFLMSEQFQGYPKLFSATQKLAAAASTHPIVFPETGHQNFCDIIFWFPFWISKKLMMGAVGQADPLNAYHAIVDQSRAFLQQHMVNLIH